MSGKIDSIVASATKLVLDDITGEMVTRNELKKRVRKRARKAAAEEARAQRATEAQHDAKTAAPKIKTERGVLPIIEDHDTMFTKGFLADVFKERPVKPVVTRFPPEPNGYLHLGHAKAIAIDFGFARYHGGETVMRYPICQDLRPATNLSRFSRFCASTTPTQTKKTRFTLMLSRTSSNG